MYFADLESLMIKHPVPTALLGHMGDMTVSFALLESQMQSFFGALIKEHQRIGQILSSYLSFANLRAAILSLYKERHGEDGHFRELKDLMAEAGKIEEERNRITHSVWAAGGTPNSITRVKITARESRGFHAAFETYDQSRLEEFVGNIRDLAERLLRFQIELMDQGKLINNPANKIW